MSATPRTDALRLKMAQLGWPSGAEPVAMIMSSHGQLERELGSPTDAPDANTTAHARINWWKDRCDDLNEQLASERALSDRLAGELRWRVAAGAYGAEQGKQALAGWKEARNE